MRFHIPLLSSIFLDSLTSLVFVGEQDMTSCFPVLGTKFPNHIMLACGWKGNDHFSLFIVSSFLSHVRAHGHTCRLGLPVSLHSLTCFFFKAQLWHFWKKPEILPFMLPETLSLILPHLISGVLWFFLFPLLLSTVHFRLQIICVKLGLHHNDLGGIYDQKKVGRHTRCRRAAMTSHWRQYSEIFISRIPTIGMWLFRRRYSNYSSWQVPPPHSGFVLGCDDFSQLSTP